MANDASHFRNLATRAYAEAEAATLENARERAAAAFETMAAQHELVAEQKMEREAVTLAKSAPTG